MNHLQTLFDLVGFHLLSQGRPARSAGHCVYYAEDGTRCAVGCLIKPEFYSEALEGNGCDNSDVVAAIEESQGFEITEDDLHLLGELQEVHDAKLAEQWLPELQRLATKFSLEFKL